MLASAGHKAVFGLDGLFGVITFRVGCSASVMLHKPKELSNSKLGTCSLSSDGDLLCLESDKSLYLFSEEGDSWSLRGSCQIPRRSSSLLFTPDKTAVIFGDKSGNVFKIPVTFFGNHIEYKDSNPLLGHLSMLSDMVISSCGKLIATSDRDEKIRVSLFQQPSVIESFCLGHEAFVSQLAFVPNSDYLLSAGGDSYLRCWEGRTGRELGAFKLEFPNLIGFSLEDCAKGSDLPVIVSRMSVTESNICVASCASHPVIFSISLTIAANGADVTWGPLCAFPTPGDCPLIDFTVCHNCTAVDDQWKICVVGLTGESPSRLVSWTPSGSLKTCQLNQLNELYVFSDELQSRLPDPNPRVELLKSMFKVNTDRSMLEAYEEMKPIRHQHVLDRRIRHQKIRQRNKKLKQSLSA